MIDRDSDRDLQLSLYRTRTRTVTASASVPVTVGGKDPGDCHRDRASDAAVTASGMAG